MKMIKRLYQAGGCFYIAMVVLALFIGLFLFVGIRALNQVKNHPTPIQIITVTDTSITLAPGYYPHLLESFYSETCGDIDDAPENLHPCWQTELYFTYNEYQTRDEALAAIKDVLSRINQ